MAIDRNKFATSKATHKMVQEVETLPATATTNDDTTNANPATVVVLATPTATTSTATLHDYEHLIWETDCEPPQHLPIATLYHLYTITGLLSIGMWPHDAIIGEHYLAWAPLAPGIGYTVH